MDDYKPHACGAYPEAICGCGQRDEMMKKLHAQLAALDAEIEKLRKDTSCRGCGHYDHNNCCEERSRWINIANEWHTKNKRLRRALDLVTHCEECCGGNLTYREMVAFCIRTARAALSEEE
jgi:hypothetical protein